MGGDYLETKQSSFIFREGGVLKQQEGKMPEHVVEPKVYLAFDVTGLDLQSLSRSDLDGRLMGIDTSEDMLRSTVEHYLNKNYNAKVAVFELVGIGKAINQPRVVYTSQR
jgi:hypothetical protein